MAAEIPGDAEWANAPLAAKDSPILPSLVAPRRHEPEPVQARMKTFSAFAATSTHGTLEWAPQRRAPRACDEALTGTARRWLRGLPHRRRPIRLCQLYPRLANRLAWVWAQPERAAQVLEDLLQDRRGGRQGFPAPVRRELERLAQFNASERTEGASEGWWSRFGRLAGID